MLCKIFDVFIRERSCKEALKSILLAMKMIFQKFKSEIIYIIKTTYFLKDLTKKLKFSNYFSLALSINITRVQCPTREYHGGKATSTTTFLNYTFNIECILFSNH